jgi:hypothetical protein
MQSALGIEPVEQELKWQYYFLPGLTESVNRPRFTSI